VSRKPLVEQSATPGTALLLSTPIGSGNAWSEIVARDPPLLANEHRIAHQSNKQE
jgi:hypothetical protein